MPSAPAANGIFSTLFCESFLGCLSPYPGGFAECICLVLPQRRRPAPNEKWVGLTASVPRTRLFTDPYFGAAAIPLCSGLRVCWPPGSFLPQQVLCRAAEAFTSEPNVHRYLCTHRIYYPPNYRQLAERGLSPRQVHSIVDCSSHPRGRSNSPESTIRPVRETIWKYSVSPAISTTKSTIGSNPPAI